MGINKKAKNIHIDIKKTDVIMAGNFTMTAKKINIEATDDNLDFNSAKKIAANGN